MISLCYVQQTFLINTTSSSQFKPKPLTFQPTGKWKIQAKAKGFGGDESNTKNEQLKKSASKATSSVSKTSIESTKSEEGDEKIPQVVLDRMIVRILVYVGVPLVTGVIILQGFDVAQEKNIDVPNWLPFLTTLITFGASALGIAIGTLSASWDEDRQGSFFGFEEAQRNWIEMWKEEDEFN